MTKSCADVVLSIYSALLADCKSAFPRLEREFERDLDSLRKYVGDRGVGAVFTDLPRLAKHLDRCLDRGQYVPSRLPLGAAVSRTVVIPNLFRGLYLLIFDESGFPRKDVDTLAITFLRQLLLLCKKVKLVCPDEKVALEIENFLQVDCSLPEPSRLWEDSAGNPEVSGSAQSFTTVLQKTAQGRDLLRNDPSFGTRLDLVFARIMAALGQYKPEEWPFRHGPGAIAATTRPSNKYHWYSWPDRLESAFPVSEFGFHTHSSWAANHASIPEGEEAGRLIAVPKTYDKPRLIAAEPSCHQWCQQNMRAYMYDRARASWINRFVRFRDQTQNQDLCRKGSVDGSLATLDLSEASDRVTCDVVEAAFRSNLNVLRSLIACRTRFVRVDLATHNCKVLHRLNKFSTMGSAVTFPVESLIFLGITLACLGDANPEDIERLTGAVSIFGDDIIVPTIARDRLVQALEALCFKVNTEKSFSGSNFRESCGVDAYRGVVVTPVYLRSLGPTTIESAVGLVETANHFYSRWQLNVSARLRRTVGERFKFPDVHPDSGVTGYATRVRPIEVPQFRWCKSLQRCEAKVASPKAEQTKARPEDDSRIFQFLTEQPGPMTNWEPGYLVRSRLKIKPRWVSIHDLYGPWIQ